MADNLERLEGSKEAENEDREAEVARSDALARLPAASYRSFLNQHDVKALLQQCYRENWERIDKNRR